MLRVGVIANEYFDPAYGRTGGFGWAAKRAIEALTQPGSGIKQVLVLPGVRLKGAPRRILGCSVKFPRRGKLVNRLRLLGQRPDLLFCIDYRPAYRVWFDTFPATPVVIWARDPRTDSDWNLLRQLRIPGSEQAPGGISQIDTRSLGVYATNQPIRSRPILIASKLPHLRAKVREVYGLDDSGLLLSNPDVGGGHSRVHAEKSDRPTVLFLGRLDPIKRPWLFVALAGRLPDVDFLMAGVNHFPGKDGWRPVATPPNLRFVGHIDGPAKYDLIATSWLLVNTSIYEESPVSVFEALQCETPVVSLTDWGGLVERFGECVGPADSEEVLVERLARAVEGLLRDAARRTSLGRAGRTFVATECNDGRFLEDFRALCRRVGLPVPDDPGDVSLAMG